MRIVCLFIQIVLTALVCIVLHQHILYIFVCMYGVRFNCWGFFVLSLLYSHSASCIYLHMSRNCFKAVTGNKRGEELFAVGFDVSEVLIKHTDFKCRLFLFFIFFFFIFVLQVARCTVGHIALSLRDLSVILMIITKSFLPWGLLQEERLAEVIEGNKPEDHRGCLLENMMLLKPS